MGPAHGSDLVDDPVPSGVLPTSPPVDTPVTNHPRRSATSSTVLGGPGTQVPQGVNASLPAGYPPVNPSPSNITTSAVGMVNKKPAVFNNSSRIMANTDEQWMEVIVRVGGLRGEACDALARFLLVRRHSSSMLAAAELAVELLDGFTEEGYENLITLLGDGWDQSISQLLDCARTL